MEKKKWLKKNKKKWKNQLVPLSSKRSITKYDFVGFDVETYGLKNKFLMGGLFWYQGKTEKIEKYKHFWSKQEMIDFLYEKRDYFKRRYIVATNLEFDFSVLFKNTKYWNNFNKLYRGSSLIFVTEKEKDKHGYLKMIDTMNYIPYSVEKWGKILGEDKLNKPSSWEKQKFNGVDILLPRKPKNYYEKQELIEYNKRDCKISCDTLYMLQKGFNDFGGKNKITSASCAMEVYRRSYQPIKLMKEHYVINKRRNKLGKNTIDKKKIKDFLFESYFGGRTEVYQRGEFENLNYYDINSLYPSVMLKNIPLPQSGRYNEKGYINGIIKYMGVTRVNITCPEDIDKPLLPKRLDGKLIFPTGTFEGVYTHAELNKALKLGYEINDIKEQMVYTKSKKLFKDYVESLYKKRKEQKKNNDPMEKVTKLLLNSLYGKFGMRKVTKTKILRDDETLTNELMKEEIGDKIFELKNGYVTWREEEEYNGKFCYPIIASYITAYARLKMYDYINRDDVIYTDTDSVIMKNELPKEKINQTELGKMALECKVEKGIFVRPKFYFLIEKHEHEKKITTKIKGVKHANQDDFNLILKGESVSKWKFVRLRESIKRCNKNVNEVEVQNKQLSLNENKRSWEHFNLDYQTKSKPLHFENNKLVNTITKEVLLNNE